MARVSLVCREWNKISVEDSVWKNCCFHHFASNARKISRRVRKQYDGSWKRAFLEEPRVRFDGVYVFTKRYFKVGGLGLVYAPNVLEISYHRVIRFFPNGHTLYALVNQFTPTIMTHFKREDPKHTFTGKYQLKDGTVKYEVQMDHLLQRFVLICDNSYYGGHNLLNIAKHTGLDKHGNDVVFRRPDASFKFEPFV